jgi:hypothetical protein
MSPIRPTPIRPTPIRPTPIRPYIILAGPDASVLHYFGTGVNTEWDVRCVRTGGQWVRAKHAERAAAPDRGCNTGFARPHRVQ